MDDEAPIEWERAGRTPARPRTAGKFFEIAGERFEPRGVTYGTFRPGWLGHPYPDRGRVRADFDTIARFGFNTVRLYTVPPEWLMDAAAARGLRLLVGTPWEQHVALLEDPGRASAVEREVRRQVDLCAGHPAIFGIAVGNEIPASIVRWTGRRRTERWLRRLHAAAKTADPELLVTYVNFPTTEYLDLPFLDFVAFNVYLESLPELDAYLARLHNRAGDRPLVMAELGMDSRAHGDAEQARILGGQIRTTLEAGCAGFFVFSWTDEWYRGGRPVTEWSFGLTTEERDPKPALDAVVDAMEAHPSPPAGGWPTISVVVCAYQAADTIAECIEGLARVDYPSFEVVLVDDGSTDATSATVEETVARLRSGTDALPDLRLVRTPNRGLSRARNLGIEEARGEIVAFLDADAWPDPAWLRHLARTFARGGYAGAGGPNIAPPGRGTVAACVAHAPGSPSHILETDRVAEHVPGCNMAFRKDALESIDGFDPRFRVAGDDVDLCWRIQESGGVIGFSPGAMVWHLPRRSIRGYWRQQVGYGVAEALLEAKWPRKYNTVGHVTWGGRVYGPGALPLPWSRGRIYGGTFGEAPFQREESGRPSLLWEIAAMPEWHIVLTVLLALSILGVAWRPLLVALPFLVVGVSLSLARAVVAARRAPFAEALPRGKRVWRRVLCGLLHLLQPLARLHGRFLSGLVPWRNRAQVGTFVWPRPRKRTLWRERGGHPIAVLERVETRLVSGGTFVRRDSGWSDWDLEVRGGGLGAARLRSCVEWHGGRRQLLRYAVVPQLRWPVLPAIATTFPLAIWAAISGVPTVSAILLLAGSVVGLRALWESGTASFALLEGLRTTLREVEAEELGAGDPITDAAQAPGAGSRPVTAARPAAVTAGEPAFAEAAARTGAASADLQAAG